MAEEKVHGKIVLGEYRMSTWKRNIMKTHEKTGNKGQNNQSTGKSKGMKPTGLQKWMCRHNRSWKDRDYAAVMATLGKRGKKGE